MASGEFIDKSDIVSFKNILFYVLYIYMYTYTFNFIILTKININI